MKLNEIGMFTWVCLFARSSLCLWREKGRVHVEKFFEQVKSLVILKLIFVLYRRVSLYWAQIQVFSVLMALFQESIKLSNTVTLEDTTKSMGLGGGTQGIEDILGL